MKIIIHPQYISKKSAIIQLVTDFFEKGEWIVRGSRNSIKSNFLENEKITIKYFQKPSLLKSIIYSFFRSTKARRSYDYANYLLKNNIQTPFPIAYVENRNRLGLLQDSYYISHHINYDFTIRELIHDPLFEERNLILEKFTEFTFKMHQAKVNFLDHSPGNTLIVKDEKGAYEFYLIDLNRMKFESLSIEQRMDNFKKMWLSKQMIKIVAQKYAQLSGESKEKLHAILLEKTTKFKRRITKKKYLKRKLKK